MHLHQGDPIGDYRRRSGDRATPACTQPCMSGVIVVHYACKYFKWFTEKHILSCHLHPIIFTTIIQSIPPTMSTPNAPIDRPSTPASAQTPPSYPTVHGVSFSLPSSSARVPPQSINDDASESAHRYNCIDHVAAAVARSAVRWRLLRQTIASLWIPSIYPVSITSWAPSHATPATTTATNP